MPTVFSHVAVPMAAAIGLGARRIPPWALAAGMLAAVAPDFDGIAFKLGIAYGDMSGHRGFTHTLLFALLLGCAGYALAPRWGMRRWTGYLWIALCAASHPLLDMFTSGGAGIPFLWPVDEGRYFAPWRPIEVSPIALRRFFSPRGAQVMLSELKFVWTPLLCAGLLALSARRFSAAPRRAAF
ncbi:MAG: metal-dependent hydrolase [Zoogloeaceae bacterium]|jgi:inner membrane protein|nr:metal-dependent hydrolase [Zoogloeaceae bacterium]